MKTFKSLLVLCFLALFVMDGEKKTLRADGLFEGNKAEEQPLDLSGWGRENKDEGTLIPPVTNEENKGEETSKNAEVKTKVKAEVKPAEEINVQDMAEGNVFSLAPPLFDEEPILMIRVKPEGIPSDKKIFDGIGTILGYLGDNKYAKQIRSELSGGSDGYFALLSVTDLLKKMKKNDVKNVWLVLEPDCLWRGPRKHAPFVAFDVHGLNPSQINSVTKAINVFVKTSSDGLASETTVSSVSGYLVTNFVSSEGADNQEEIEFLEDKISEGQLKKWPEDIRNALEKYEDCDISAVFVFLPMLAHEMQLETKRDEEGMVYAEALQKTMNDLWKANCYAAGFDFRTKTLSISVFMETAEDAKNFKENSLNTTTEFLKYFNQKERFGVKEKDIQKFVNGIDVSVAENVVTYTFTEEWLNAQKSFISMWEEKEMFIDDILNDDSFEDEVAPDEEEAAPAEDELLPMIE